MTNQKTLFAFVVLLFTAVFSASASAAGVDFSSLTTAVDFSTAITAIVAIGAALAGAYVAFKGVKIVVTALRGT